MLYWAFIFFVVSIVAYIFGANGIAGVSMDIAQFLVAAFLIVAGIFLAIALAGAAKIKSFFKPKGS